MAKVTKNGAKIDAKSIKNDSWERLGEVLGKGLLQDPQIWGTPDAFLDPFGATWSTLGATLGPLGAKWRPKGAKMDPKMDQKSMPKSMHKSMPKKY